jgi:hypothetical protein
MLRILASHNNIKTECIPLCSVQLPSSNVDYELSVIHMLIEFINNKHLKSTVG